MKSNSTQLEFPNAGAMKSYGSSLLHAAASNPPLTHFMTQVGTWPILGFLQVQVGQEDLKWQHRALQDTKMANAGTTWHPATNGHEGI